MKKIKLSELPEASEYDGLYTLGTDKNNVSKKVALDKILAEATSGYVTSKDFADSQSGQNTKIEAAVNDAAAAKETAESAAADATNALTTANNAQSTAQQALTAVDIANDAVKTANAAKETANAVDITASDAAQVAGNAIKASDTNAANIAALTARVDAFEAEDNYRQSDYCVGEWVDGAASPDAVKIYGDTSVCWNWHAYLIDTTDNTRTTTRPVGELSPKNWLRFADGRFAPTVGITEAMRADSDLALYRLNSDGDYELYCEAGAYDAEEYLENVLRPVVQATPNDLTAAKLYKLVDEEYVEAHALLPWETTETKYSIGVGYGQELYLLDNVVGNSGKAWKGIFLKPTIWDGIDVTPWKLARTAICPSPITTVGNKARCFFFAYEGETNCKSSAGEGNLCTMFLNGRTYPRMNDVTQITNMKYARTNNADDTAPYPCAEGGFHAFNTFITAVEVGMGTKYIHAASRFSSGISANDTCNSEATMNAYGGVRCRVSGTEAWTYYTWGANGLIAYNTSGATTNSNNLLAGQRFKEQCMESQMAYSWAQEFNVSEGTKYQFYDAPYWFANVTTNSSYGLMNARVYKNMAQTFSAYNTSGEKTTFDCEVVLRMGLYNGINLSGDTWSGYGGGYEQVGVNDGTGAVGGNLPVYLYLEPDQTRWLYETSGSKTSEKFEFESTYKLLGNGVAANDYGFTGARVSYSGYKTVVKGSISTYECCAIARANYWDSSKVAGRRTRIRARFRGSASNAYCAPRSQYADITASYVGSVYGGSAQFLIE